MALQRATKPTTAAWVMRRLVRAGLISLAMQGASLAQTPAQTPAKAPGGSDVVTWTVSVTPADAVKPGSLVQVAVQGAVVDGWHLYGLEQLPTGPIPLKVSLDASDVAVADGALKATAPTKVHDPSFNLETQYYPDAFTITAPARIGSNVASGVQQIPVTVRFQTCNGKTCHPPKTVHLSASVTVRAAG